MAIEILATGDTAANSGDITIAAGASLNIGLKGVASGAKVLIALKDDAGAYNPIDMLTGDLNANHKLLFVGTYRFTRVAGAACGVFSA